MKYHHGRNPAGAGVGRQEVAVREDSILNLVFDKGSRKTSALLGSLNFSAQWHFDFRKFPQNFLPLRFKICSALHPISKVPLCPCLLSVTAAGVFQQP